MADCAVRVASSRRPGASMTVVAGYGNNGGDGLVAARSSRRDLGIVRYGCSILGDEGGVPARCATVVSAPQVWDRRRRGHRSCGGAASLPGCADHRCDPRHRVALTASPRRRDPSLNESAVAVLSVDVPSGLDATTGEASDPTVRAALTCTLTAMGGVFASAMPRVTPARCGLPTSGCPRPPGSAPGSSGLPASPAGSWCTLRLDLPP